MARRAIVLLSGGLDSATVLYYAMSEGYRCYCLIFDYGQRHRREIESARRIARDAKCASEIVKIDFPWKGSSLLDKKIKIPINVEVPGRRNAKGIPNTYVSARNIIFLSFALSYAEAIGAGEIFIGVNAVDYSGYPDCRPEFVEAFRKVIETGTRAGEQIRVEAPLINKNKREIVELAKQLGVPLKKTWSCYKGAKAPCGVCDSCLLRARGFREAGLNDPAQ